MHRPWSLKNGRSFTSAARPRMERMRFVAYETIIYAADDHGVTITLNRPAALNALTRQMRAELLDGLKRAAADGEARALTLAGAGKAFSVGQDLKEMEHDYQSGMNLGQLVRDEYMPLVRTLRAMPKPTIALVQGTALGGGMALALACDFRVLSPDARFIAGFVHVGLAPDTGTSFLLPKMIGQARALEIFLTGSPITAEDAVRYGLSSEVHGDRERAEAAARSLAKLLAAGPTKAYAAIRQLVDQTAAVPLEDAMAKEMETQASLSLTQDHLAAVAAFLDKRKPDYTGT